MRIRFATNASVLVTLASGARILCDPWFSGGIYYGSWYNFPPLTDRQRAQFVGSKPDYIYISHLHPDHLDAATLVEFDRQTPMLIGKLPHPHLSRALRRLGFTDVRELPLDQLVSLGEAELSILPQFTGTSDGTPDDVNYALDSSLLIRDADRTTFFHCVDNPIKPEDGARVAERFGPIDLAILPYSGASFYPHAFSAWTDQDKLARAAALRGQKLDALVAVAHEVRARAVIPAAGSYVMGGRIAGYTRYLHQATPAELKARWAAESDLASQLLFLAPGDAVEVPSLALSRDEEQPWAEFDDASRRGYALMLSGRPLPQDEIRVPGAFVIPWARLLEKARRNLWTSQQRLKLAPAVDVVLHIREVPGAPLQGSQAQFRFPLDSADLPADPASAPTQGRAWVGFTIDSSLLLMLLVGGAVWNNVEIGALVECEREPDVYNPTVHSLMSFFAL